MNLNFGELNDERKKGELHGGYWYVNNEVQRGLFLDARCCVMPKNKCQQKMLQTAVSARPECQMWQTVFAIGSSFDLHRICDYPSFLRENPSEC